MLEYMIYLVGGYTLLVAFKVLELYAHVVVGDGHDGYTLLVDVGVA